MQSPSTLKNHPNKLNIIFGLILSSIFTIATLYVAYLELSNRVHDNAFQKPPNKKGEGIQNKTITNSKDNTPEYKGNFSQSK